MKKILPLFMSLFLVIALSACTKAPQDSAPQNRTVIGQTLVSSTTSPPFIDSTPDTPTTTENAIVKFDAEPLPANITVKDRMNGGEYEVVIKNVTFREISALEKEDSYFLKSVTHIAIIRYSSHSLKSTRENYHTLDEEFAIVLGDQTFNFDFLYNIFLEESEYQTEDYAEDYYQGYIVIAVSQEAAESTSTQLRYVEKGTKTPIYYDIYE